MSIDGDLILTDTTMIGSGNDVHVGIEEVIFTGSNSDNKLDASAFTLGSVTLDGADGNDTLLGSANDDVLIGGNGTDQVWQTVSANQVLTDSQLLGMGSDAISEIEEAQLTGGPGNDSLDASGFTSGPVSLDGGNGDDTLIGSVDDDVLDGGNGTDLVQQTSGADQVLSDTQLTGVGTDDLTNIEEAHLSGDASSNTLNATAFTLGPVTLDGGAADDTLFGSSGDDSLVGGPGDDRLLGSLGDDTFVGGTGADQIEQVVNADQVLTDSQLTGQGTDALSEIETVVLTGGNSNNSLDASGFSTGPVTLNGSGGNDTLIGSLANDSLNGGNGIDLVRQTFNGNQTLDDNTLVGLGTDSLSNIERAHLAGGDQANLIDASSFSLGSVTLDGSSGDDTLSGSATSDSLIGGTGTDTVQQTSATNQFLTDNQLSGTGLDALDGIEQAFLSGTETNNLIDASAFSLGSVTLNGNAGDDTLIGSLSADALNGGSGSDRVEQTTAGNQVLGNSVLTGRGPDTLASIEAALLTGSSGNNLLDASAFSLGGVTLDGADGDDTLLGTPLDDELRGGNGLDRIEQTVDADQSLSDTQLTGHGTDTIDEIEEALLTGGASANVIDASSFTSGSVTINGNGADDTLFGSIGNDQINGGDGTDRVTQIGDVNWTLNDTLLVGEGTDAISSIEEASLTGGDSSNTLDASGFSGDTTLDGGDGDDTLLGGTGIDEVRQTADSNQVLTTVSLTGLGNNTLANIDRAALTGGASANLLDASTFTPGPVTLTGGQGNDTLIGSAGNDQLNGDAGTDQVLLAIDNDIVLDDTQLNGMGSDGLSGIEEAVLTGGVSDNLLDASGFSGKTTLSGGAGDDDLRGGTGIDRVEQTADADQTLTNSQLTGQGVNALSNIEEAFLTGGGTGNSLDASNFSAGAVTLDGNGGPDTLLGSPADDMLIGGDGLDQISQTIDTDQVLADTLVTGMGTDTLESVEQASLAGGLSANVIDATAFTLGSVTLDGADGNDTLRGSAHDDQFEGGTGTDEIQQTVDADQSLTNVSLTGRGSDVLNSIEQAQLTGGASGNVISASSFTAGSVTLDGADGDDTLIGGSHGDQLIGQDGDDVLNGRGDNDSLSGGDGADRLQGGGAADLLEGGDGQDTLSGQGGRDSLFGADGNDLLNGGDSPDTVIGGRGADELNGGNGGDLLNGSGGNDQLHGQSGPDRLFGGAGTDLLVGGEGNDKMLGQGSRDVIEGGEGDDTLWGGPGNDQLLGGSGFDRLVESADVDLVLTSSLLVGLGTDVLVSLETARLIGGMGDNDLDASAFPGSVTLIGASGNDRLTTAAGDDLLNGGNGDDTFSSGSGLDSINGGNGFDRITSSGDGSYIITDSQVTASGTTHFSSVEAVDITSGAGDNLLDASGFSGDTTLIGGSGRDSLIGGSGNDLLNGNGGVDSVIGGPGNDRLHGGQAGDIIDGGDGDDTLNGEAGDDTIIGGPGNDILLGEDGHDRLLGRDGDDTLFGNMGNDSLAGDGGNDMLNGGDGHDVLLGEEGNDALRGGNGEDVLSGDSGNDRLFGQSGNDTLLGGSGNDGLQGGNHRDVLQAGDGDDTLNGQSGVDTLTAGDGRDRINANDLTALVNELFTLPADLFARLDEIRSL